MQSSQTNQILRVDKGVAEVIECPLPHPKEGFVLVEQEIAPVCTEHLAYATGLHEGSAGRRRAPMDAGHEGVGIVREVGPGITDLREGDRVIIFQFWPCGTCWVCSRGLSPTHCPNLRSFRDIADLHGVPAGASGFSRFRIAPATMVHKIPATLPFRYAAAAMCLVGCTYTAVNELGITSDDYCLVTGVGFIGHGTITNLKFRGAKTIAMGRSTTRMQLAADVGADLLLNPDDEHWLDELREFCPDRRGVDAAFECSGVPSYQLDCLEALRPYGALMLLGYPVNKPDTKLSFNVERDLQYKHASIRTSFDVSVRDRQRIVELLAESPVQAAIDHMITGEFPMTRASEAFEMLLDAPAGKVYLDPRK